MDNTIIEKITEFSTIVKKNYNVDSVILYGSYAKNEANANSDIDVAVVFDKITTDYLKLMTDLYKLATDIDDRIETVLIEKFDDKSGFLESILTYGKKF